MLNALLSSSNLGSESRRLLHGRGGFFEGLEEVAIDWFAPVILVTLYFYLVKLTTAKSPSLLAWATEKEWPSPTFASFAQRAGPKIKNAETKPKFLKSSNAIWQNGNSP